MSELDPRSPYTPQGDPFNDQDLRTRTVLHWICGCGINAADRILPLQKDLPALEFRESCRPRQPAHAFNYRARRWSRCASATSASGVRRDKAALSSGCKPHPATAPAGSNRSSHGGNEVAEAFD
jgi:hypothetical protein